MSTPDTFADYKGKRYLAKDGKVVASYSIKDTPDTEWATKEAQRLFELTLDCKLVPKDIEYALTSRDTYWKERVTEKKIELITTIIDRFETHGLAYLNTLKTILKDITNEDNLK